MVLVFWFQYNSSLVCGIILIATNNFSKKKEEAAKVTVAVRYLGSVL